MELSEHPNKHFVSHIISGITNGFDLGFRGKDDSYIAQNMRSVVIQKDVVRNYIKGEITAGRVMGPFKEPPFSFFRCSPIGVVPKKTAGKFRVIMNLSKPKGSSVNDCINKEDFSLSYVTVDQAIDKILSLGKGCLLTKVDVETAFRIVPVKPEQWNLLGFQFDNEFF